MVRRSAQSPSTSVKVACCNQCCAPGEPRSPNATTTPSGAASGGSARSTVSTALADRLRVLLDERLLVQLAGVRARQLCLERDRARTLVMRQPIPQPGRELVGELVGGIGGIDGLHDALDSLSHF